LGLSTTAPAEDQIEISLFGPGYGECCLIHLGSGKWVIVDSCIDADGVPAALGYLSSLQIDPAQAVEWIVATHWHDDHIRGLAKTVSTCANAQFCASAALRANEFLTTLAQYDQQPNSVAGSGVKEIFAVLDELARTGRKFSRAFANRRLARMERENFAHGSECEIWTLTPSDTQFNKGILEIGNLVPRLYETKRRFPAQNTNLLSIVTLISIGPLGILLGGDLEETGSADLGWTAIVESRERPQIKSKIFKIPHHGSLTAHCDKVWTEMVAQAPISVATPFNFGRKPLPAPSDVERITALSKDFYLTSVKAEPKQRRDPAVDKMVKQVGQIRPLSRPMGIVRLRNKGESDPDSWTVELSENAARLA
jgi:hypothetical protein